ncbi:MAG: putative lipid II flippase FtsW [Gammaproteobacteria bacterium]|nr:putative lipid II flippase FtsW [Gammaproteobacteria bacterium]
MIAALRGWLSGDGAAPVGRAVARLRSAQPQGLDPTFCLAAAVLLAWGLVMVASASVAVGEQAGDGSLHFFYKQLGYAGLGVLAGALAFVVPMQSWEQSGWTLLAFAVFLLGLVLIPGVGIKVNNARRWLDLELFRLQASEPARLALIMYFAGALVRRQAAVQNRLPALVKLLLPLGFAAALLLLEPDFGAAAVLFGVALLMLFMAGARLLHLGALGLAVGGLGAVLIVTAAYRLRRLLSFTDPWADINNGGWQLAQSLIAVGRGEWTGVGLGNSLQKLLYLPERHTDFIFAILAEEFGLLGILVLLALFGVLVWRGFAIAAAAETRNRRFSAYLAYGLSTWVGLQALVNMAVNMGLLPTKGLTLPLISYGGSSLVTVCVLLALILRVDYENRVEASRAPAGGFGA